MNANDGKIKILHIITRLEFGGPPLSLMDLIARLDKEKFDVSLATGFTPDRKRDMIEDARKLNIDVFTVSSLVRDVRILSDIRAFWQIMRIIKKGGYHIVHCHTSKAGFIGPLAAKLAGARCVLYSPHGTILHGYFGRLKTKVFILLQRFAALFIDKIICLSRIEISQYLEVKIGSPRKYTFIHNGIDVESMARRRADSLTMRKMLGIGADDFVGISVGRLVPVKGYRDLIEAIRLLKPNIPNIRLLLVGDGSERKALEKQAESAGLSNHVRFTGLRRDIAEILSCADLFLLSSLNEGFGLVLVEAMAMRLPIVATRVGGVPEVVEHEKTGILVAPEDPQAMGNAIARLYCNRQWGKELGAAGYERAQNTFDICNITEQYEQFYSYMLNGTMSIDEQPSMS
jgi:glycosyltransferase involved in cell wall biosynthesis